MSITNTVSTTRTYRDYPIVVKDIKKVYPPMDGGKPKVKQEVVDGCTLAFTGAGFTQADSYAANNLCPARLYNPQ